MFLKRKTIQTKNICIHGGKIQFLFECLPGVQVEDSVKLSCSCSFHYFYFSH